MFNSVMVPYPDNWEAARPVGNLSRLPKSCGCLRVSSCDVAWIQDVYCSPYCGIDAPGTPARRKWLTTPNPKSQSLNPKS